MRTTVKASDPSGVKSAQVNGVFVGVPPATRTLSPKAQGAFTIEWKLTDKLGNVTVACGKKFTVQLRAYDKAGNVKTLAKRTYRR